MDAGLSHNETHGGVRGRPVRALVVGLFVVWSIFLAVTDQVPASFIVAAIAALISVRFFEATGDPGQTRGSLLIAGTLLFCAYFLTIFVSAGGACLPAGGCGDGSRAANVAIAILAFVAAVTGIGEVFQSVRPSSTVRLWTHRFALAGVLIAGALFVVLGLFSS